MAIEQVVALDYASPRLLHGVQSYKFDNNVDRNESKITRKNLKRNSPFEKRKVGGRNCLVVWILEPATAWDQFRVGL